MGASQFPGGRRCGWQGLHVENVVRLDGLHARLGSPSFKTRPNTNLSSAKSMGGPTSRDKARHALLSPSNLLGHFPLGHLPNL